jgi:hypothetical protein
MKHYSPPGRRYHGRPLKRLLDTWDRNGSTSGPTPWQTYDDDDDDDDDDDEFLHYYVYCSFTQQGWHEILFHRMFSDIFQHD